MNVPKLRFPEFLGAGEWEEMQLGNVSDVRDGTHDSPKFYGMGRPLVTSKNLMVDGSLDLKNVGLISETDYEQINRRSRVEVGDILFGMIGTVGNPVMVQSEGFAIKNVALIKQQNLLLNSYLVHLMNSEYIAQKLSILISGNTQKFIALGKLRGLDIAIPNLPEQQKIANCLSSLDDLVTAETQKLAALKDHKKGLMQQLFPQTGETTPRLRFAEFLGAGEWEESKLSGLIDTITPPQKLSTASYQMDGEYPIIDQSQSYICGWTNNQDALIADDLPLIIFGDHTCILKIIKMPFAQGADGIKILKTKSRIDALFLYQYLKFSPVVMEEYKRHFSILKEKLILFPKIDTSEQQKTANCLSSLDELITAQSQKIEALKRHKKGLMQGLFPNTEEVGA